MMGMTANSEAPSSPPCSQNPDDESHHHVGESQGLCEKIQSGLPASIPGLLQRLGQELTCPICLGILQDAIVSPCQHSFCRACVERMLRVNQKTDGACPICKLPLSRRSVRPSPVLQSAAVAFEQLAEAYQQSTGDYWEDGDLNDKEVSFSGVSQPSRCDIFVTSNVTPKRRLVGTNGILPSDHVFISSETGNVIKQQEAHGVPRNSPIPSTITRKYSDHKLDLSTGQQRSPAPGAESEFDDETIRGFSSRNASLVTGDYWEDERLVCHESEWRALPKMNLSGRDSKCETKIGDDCQRPSSSALITRGKHGGRRPIVICTSRCAVNVASILAGIDYPKGIRHVRDFDAKKVTHLVIGVVPPLSLGEGGDSGGAGCRIAASRTFKYLQAILTGCWIVSEAWLYDSYRAGHPLPESDYEVHGDEAFPDESAPMRARLNRGDGGCSLFSSLLFVLQGDFLAPTKDQLVSLIEMGGGRVLTERSSRRLPPGADVIRILDETAEITRTCAAGDGHRADVPGECKTLPSSWVLACVSSFQILQRDQVK